MASAGTVWVSARHSRSVMAVGRGEALLKGTALRREAVPKPRASARQRNYSMKKLWCSVDAIYISCLLSNCAFVTPHNAKYLAKLKKKAATFQIITKQNCLNTDHKNFIELFLKTYESIIGTLTSNI